jgi:L-alanine-DL-glutamate epimerase-like enolase superfamily enzyme
VKVVEYRTFVCKFGWRTISFLKLTTDEGIVGWSEFSEGFGSPGLTGIVDACSSYVLGKDPVRIEAITHPLSAAMRPARGGVNRQAVAAIENALLDVKGKALGLPVADMFGGIVRDRLPVYWSHCGSYRIGKRAEHLGVEPLRTFDDVVALGRLVKSQGFLGLKTNILGLEDPAVATRANTFARGLGAGRHWDSRMIAEAVKVVRAFREAVGDDVDIHLDVNFNFDPDGAVRVERAVREYGLAWLEADLPDPEGLAYVRTHSETPIGSGEAVYERFGYKPYFEAQAFDCAIVDVLWNGYIESLKIAALAETYQVPVAPHNFYGHLASMISAHFSASVPNFHVMEIDVDGMPWRDELTTPPVFENGELVLPDKPGWGVEVNEAALVAYAV